MSSQTTTSNPKASFKTLKLIHFAMCMGILMFMGVAYFQTIQKGFSFINSDDVFLYILPPIAIAGLLIGNKIFSVLINKIERTDTFTIQFSKLQLASLIKYALIEGPALIAILYYMRESNLAYLAIAVALLAYMLFSRPTKDNIQSYLKLNTKDTRHLTER